MTEEELKARIAKDFQSAILNVAAAETLQSNENPFSRVVFRKEFLEAQLKAPVMSDEELMKVVADIDNAIEENKSLPEVVGLLQKGLMLLAKYGVIG